MEKITIEKAKNDLIEIFNAVTFEEFRNGDHLSWYSEDNDVVTFHIDKQRCERFETIEKLREYFDDKVIDGGFCSISPITFVWTDFELKKGKPNTL